jgi:hypothetical protein
MIVPRPPNHGIHANGVQPIHALAVPSTISPVPLSSATTQIRSVGTIQQIKKKKPTKKSTEQTVEPSNEQETAQKSENKNVGLDYDNTRIKKQKKNKKVYAHEEYFECQVRTHFSN